MSWTERELAFKSTAEKTFSLLGGSSVTGRIFNGRAAKSGLQPYFGAKDCGFTGVPGGVSAGYVAADGCILLYAGGSLYYKTAESTAFTLAAGGLAREPYFFENENGVTASDGVINVVISGGAVTQSAAKKALYGGALHYERLFGADEDGFTVRWSAAGTVDGWDEGIRNSGWLKLPASRGKILRLVPYDDKLIAVRESGLSVIKAYGSTESFRIINADTASPDITEGTAAVCADKLFFAAGNGLYAFDGNDIERVAQDGLEGAGNILCGAACGNTYFATLYLGGEKVIACVDGESGEVSYCSFAADCIFAGGRVYAAADGALYELYSPAENVLYDSGYTNLGAAGRKYLKYIVVDGGAGCTLTVETCGISRIFGGVSGKTAVKMTGENFRITLSAGSPVKSVTAVFEI